MIELTSTQIEEALPWVAPGLRQYVWLQEHRDSNDLRKDSEYRKRFNHFYRVRRGTEWRDTFYSLLQKKKGLSVSFGEVLRALHRATDRHEPSFASGGRLSACDGPGLGDWIAPRRRPLPPWPRKAVPAHRQAGPRPRALHHRGDDVPRDGDAPLAGAGRGRDERGGVSHAVART